MQGYSVRIKVRDFDEGREGNKDRVTSPGVRGHQVWSS